MTAFLAPILASAWRSACARVDELPSSFDAGLVAAILALVITARVTDAVHRRSR